MNINRSRYDRQTFHQMHESRRVGSHEEVAAGTVDRDGQESGQSEKLIKFKP